MPDTAAAPSAAGSIPARVFGVVTDRRTYASVAYLLSRFPLGIAYFVTFVTGIALGVALLPLLVGVPILAGVAGIADHVGRLEAALLRGLLGREVRWEPLDPGELSAVSYLKTAGTDARAYLLVAYSLATFFVGVASFVVVVTLLAVALAYLVAPVAFWLPGVTYAAPTPDVPSVVDLGWASVDLGPVVDLLTIDTVPEALVGSAVGIAVGVAALHLFNALTEALAAVTEAVLADG